MLWNNFFMYYFDGIILSNVPFNMKTSLITKLLLNPITGDTYYTGICVFADDFYGPYFYFLGSFGGINFIFFVIVALKQDAENVWRRFLITVFYHYNSWSWIWLIWAFFSVFRDYFFNQTFIQKSKTTVLCSLSKQTLFRKKTLNRIKIVKVYPISDLILGQVDGHVGAHWY